MKNRQYLSTLFLLFITCITYSQSDLTKVIPPSPTAASLGKYGDFPVSTYTGTPNISIPVYEIKDKGLSVPITLNYHASGIKVEEEASWVGLGWSLSAGGVITRSVRGTDDLVSDGISTGFPVTPLPASVNDNNEYVPPVGHPDYTYFKQVCGGTKDAEPDIYYFNFLGRSGKFVFQQNHLSDEPFTVQLSSQEKIRVYYDDNPQYPHWAIITADGYKYMFGTTEKSRTSTIPYLGNPNATFLDPRTMVSSWYLDEIIGPRDEHIVFTYTPPSQNGSRQIISMSDSRRIFYDFQVAAGSPSCHSPSGVSTGHNYTVTQNIVYDVYLKQIDFPNGKVEFFTSDRTDIEPYSDRHTPLTSRPQKLDRVVISKVEDGVYTPLKRVELGYNYFANPYTSDLYANTRLKLETVTEKSDNISKKPYRFEYNYVGGPIDEQVPAKNSYGRDHWGYYNKKPNDRIYDIGSQTKRTATLIPQQFYKNKQGENISIPGADREPDPNYMMGGMLKKITFPTGGTTDFIYEPNDYYTTEKVTIKHREYVHAYGPGFIDPDTDVPAIKSFTLAARTTVKVSGSVYQSADTYCNNDETYAVIAGGIHATGSTHSYQKVFWCNIGCGPSGFFEYYLIMEPGTYEVEADFMNSDQESYVSLEYDIATTDQAKGKMGGGVRIAKIISYDGVNHASDIITRYTYVDDYGFSSGKLMAPLNYGYFTTVYKSFSESTTGGNCPVAYWITLLDLSAESNIPLGTSAMGNPVGYSTVTEWKGENGENGKTVYTYSNNADGVVMVKMPTIPNPRNGFLLGSRVYKRKADNTGFQLVTETIREPKTEYDQERSVKGLKCYACESAFGESLGELSYPYIRYYDIYSEWVHVNSETVRNYDAADESKYQETVTQFTYGNPAHLQLTKQEQTKSDGSTLITEYTYPADYTQINTGIIAGMRDDDHYMHSSVIEKVVKLQRGADTKVIGASFVKYGTPSGDTDPRGASVVPVEEYELEINSPKSNFTSSLSTGTPADNAYKLKQRFLYNGYNISEVQKKDDVKRAYLWSYNASFPVAEVVNAAVANVFYNSFEHDDPSDYNIDPGSTIHSNVTAITGISTFSGGMSKELPAGNYRVTCWCQPSGNVTVNGASGTVLQSDGKNGWKLYQWDLTNVSTVAINGTEIDEVRIYPPNAQMVSYTYDPLVGITSQCDASNKVTYYLYDDLFRLTAIKDMKGNIIKTFKYNYKQ